MKSIVRTAAPVVALILSAPVIAADAGRILSTEGAVSIQRGQTKVAVKAGSLLESGDVLTTGQNGRVQWLTPDESIVGLAPQSTLSIAEYTWNKGSGTSRYQLAGGAVGVVSGEIQAPAYQLSTPMATLTVNGTKYRSVLCVGNCPGFADGQYVGVTEGKVTVSNSGGSLVATEGEVVFIGGVGAAPVQVSGMPSVTVFQNTDFNFNEDAPGELIERARQGRIVERALSPS